MSTETEDMPTAVAGEGGESLDALALEAGTLDAAPAAAESQAQQAQAVALAENNAGELLAGLMMARTMALPILPAPKGELLRMVWTDDVLRNVAQAGADVLTLHGITVGSILGRYAPYIALIAAVAPPVLASRAILTAPEPKPDGQQQPA